MAPKTRPPEISPEPQGTPKAPGSKPTVSMPLRRAPAGGRSPGRFRPGGGSCRRGVSSHVSGASPRGSASSGCIRFFSLRASWVRRVVHTHQSQPLPEVLQRLLPSGFASGDRTGTALATALFRGSAATPHGPLSWALSSLIGMFHGHTRIYASFAPQKEEGAGGYSRPLGAPPFPFSNSRIPEAGR